MRIAVPVADGKLSSHFGRCEEFVLVDVDDESKKVIFTTRATPPAHAPGVIPNWLSALHVTVIIAGGMGEGAMQMFETAGITVVRNVAGGTPEKLVPDYLANNLLLGEDQCDHVEGNGCHHGDDNCGSRH